MEKETIQGVKFITCTKNNDDINSPSILIETFASSSSLSTYIQDMVATYSSKIDGQIQEIRTISDFCIKDNALVKLTGNIEGEDFAVFAFSFLIKKGTIFTLTISFPDNDYNYVKYSYLFNKCIYSIDI